MKIHQYMQGRAVRYFKPVIFDDGNKVILSGGGLRIFDCQKEKFVQTISRLCNAISGLSYSESKLFVINATSKGSVIVLSMNVLAKLFAKCSDKQSRGSIRTVADRTSAVMKSTFFLHGVAKSVALFA